MKTRRGLLLTPKGAPDNQLKEKLGAIARLMSRSKRYHNYPTAYLCMWIEPALITNQAAIFYRRNDSEPVGFITWAFLSAEVEHRWRRDPRALLHLSDWNEDGNLWIVDFMAAPGFCEDIVEFINENMFKEHAQLHYRRININGSIKKICHWIRRLRRS